MKTLQQIVKEINEDDRVKTQQLPVATTQPRNEPEELTSDKGQPPPLEKQIPPLKPEQISLAQSAKKKFQSGASPLTQKEYENYTLAAAKIAQLKKQKRPIPPALNFMNEPFSMTGAKFAFVLQNVLIPET